MLRLIGCVRLGRFSFRAFNDNSIPSSHCIVLRMIPRSWYVEEARSFLAEILGLIANSVEWDRSEKTFDRVLIPENPEMCILDIFVPSNKRTGAVKPVAYVQLSSEALVKAVLQFQHPADAPIDIAQIVVEPYQRVERKRPKPEGSMFSAKKRVVRTGRYTVEEEQQKALERMTLDRYLMDPDLLWGIERMHMPRYIRRGAPVPDAFLPVEEGSTVERSDPNAVFEALMKSGRPHGTYGTPYSFFRSDS